MSELTDMFEKDTSVRARMRKERQLAQARAARQLLQRRRRSLRNFLTWWTAEDIAKKLSAYVLEQPELLMSTANFLRYHAMRQLYPQLPMRPMLITGPSGSGKTEVFRCVQRLFSDVFHVVIADASGLSGEGWSGNFKVDTYLDQAMADGGILVFDEFDKLVKPSYNSQGENITHRLQAELLKLMEGDYRKAERGKDTGLTFQKMGLVMIGAFADLQKGEEPQSRPLGFLSQTPPAAEAAPLCEQDFIKYGILPELMGRIAVHVQIRDLDADAYRKILQGPNSRITCLQEILKEQGLNVNSPMESEELSSLIETARSSHLGIRWVSAQMENRILASMQNLRFSFPPEQEPEDSDEASLDLVADF